MENVGLAGKIPACEVLIGELPRIEEEVGADDPDGYGQEEDSEGDLYPSLLPCCFVLDELLPVSKDRLDQRVVG